MYDPLEFLPDVDPDAKSRAVPLNGKPLAQLLFGNWSSGSIGESEYFQAWTLVWLALGPILLLGGVLYLTGLLDTLLPAVWAASALIAVLFVLIAANLGAKRARSKGLPGWIGSLASLAGWALLPFMHSAAVPLIAIGPAIAGKTIDLLAERRRRNRVD